MICCQIKFLKSVIKLCSHILIKCEQSAIYNMDTKNDNQFLNLLPAPIKSMEWLLAFKLLLKSK